ncbi:MAG: PEP-CTERM sorting domain-containing protein [Planctomycetes bacterium]|nr:PEP-CTERM sorting domain-containing protein [Planctomycetota bacterium]
MTEWTASAREEVDRYLSRAADSARADGADPKEVVEDLRRHIEAEVAAAGIALLSRERLCEILARLGRPDPLPPAPAPSAPPAAGAPTPVAPARPVPGWWRSLLVIVFGVLLPAGTLLFELANHECAGLFFDPIPTLWHAGLIALVPLTQAFLWGTFLRGKPLRRPALGGALLGVALGISGFYALLFIPIVPVAFVGILAMGLGFLPLSPLLSFLAGLLVRGELRRAVGSGRPDAVRPPATWHGIVLAMLALALIETPRTVTRVAVRMTASSDPAEVLRGVRWLRWMYDEETLLAMCYGLPSSRDLIGAALSLSKPITPPQAQNAYFLATGRGFFEAARPSHPRVARGWADRREVLDFDQGGDAVGGRVTHLTLEESQIDGSVDADAALAYLEWTLTFRNESAFQREARAQITLPPGGLVSRLTLWLDGEEREAAYAARGKVREAYQNVVVRQRLDPAFVTTCGKDRVLLQCFPVPPGGGVMKVKIEISAPLQVTAAPEAFLPMPILIERNFDLNPTTGHAVWFESKEPIETVSGALKSERPNERLHGVRGQVSDAALSTGEATLRVRRATDRTMAWTLVPFDDEGRIILQTLEPSPVSKFPRLVVVVDGSRSMKGYLREIALALKALPPEAELSILVASDTVLDLSGPLRQRPPAEIADLARQLESLDMEGGCDNAPALARAWDLAAEHADGVILWIHGPQPALLSVAGSLRQRWERRPQGPVTHEIRVQAGPSRMTESMRAASSRLQTLPRLGTLEQDIARRIDLWSGKMAGVTTIRERIPKPAALDETARTSMHLAKLWAGEEVDRLRATPEGRDTAVALAAGARIVTEVSGAVVLQNKEQYAQAGLTPVDPQSVPSIPEPGTTLLLATGAAAIWAGCRGKRRRVRCLAA